MVKCAYMNCKNSETNSPKLSFFRFPVLNKERCSVWINNCGKKSLALLPLSKLQRWKVCSVHFEDRAFTNNLRNRLLFDHPFAVPEPWTSGDDPSVNETIAEVNLKPEGGSPSSSGTESNGATGGRKRAQPEPEKSEKKQEGRPKKKVKTAEGIETEWDSPETFCQDPLEIIDIEEPKIKEEIFETEEFNEITTEHILPDDGLTHDGDHGENILCTPRIIKEERQDVESSIDRYAPETVIPVPEFVGTVIKSEPREEEEDDDEEESQEIPLKWRCPLVSCPEMFSVELEMFKHLNINHKIRGLALVTKAVKVVPSGSSGPSLLSHTAPVTVASQSVPSSSCVSSSVTTTTISYSLSAALSSLVTTVANSTVTSVSSATHSTHPSGPPASSPVVLSTSTLDVSASPCVASPTPSQEPHNHPVAPISDQDSNSSVPKRFHLNPQQTLQPYQESTKKVSTAANIPLLQIFNPSEQTTEDFPPCATDDSEMFLISLARFPQNRRAPIKRKMIGVVDCMIQKNIGPDELLIAFYEERSDTRTM